MMWEAELARAADPATMAAWTELIATTPPAADGEGPDGRSVKLVPASSVRMRPTRWAWTDRVPLGGVTLLVGQEGSGKTSIAADIGARATRGTLDGDLAGEPVGVVYATAEDSWSRTLAPRFAAAGADLERVYFVEVDGLAGGLSVPGDLDLLAARMHDTDARLLVLDPLGAHLSDGLDTHRDAAVRRALAPLAAYMDALGACAIGVMHWSKAPTTVALDRVNGSRAFTAAARAMLAVAGDPEDDDSRLLIVTKSNLGRIDAPALRFATEGREVVADDGSIIATSGIRWAGEAPGVTARDVFATPDDPDERSDRDAVAEVIAEVLTDGPQQRDVVLRAVKGAGLDVSGKTIQRACRSLGVERRRIGFGSTFVLALPIPDTGQETHRAVQYVQIGAGQGLPTAHSGHCPHSGQQDKVTDRVSTLRASRHLRRVETFADGTPVPFDDVFLDDEDAMAEL